MPKRVLIMLGGIAAAGMAVGPQARAQGPRGEQEVSPSATREVGTQLVAGFTIQGPFTPTAPDQPVVGQRRRDLDVLAF
jgi:hypothetical protein